MTELKLVNSLDFQIEKEEIIVLEVEDGSKIKFRAVLLDIIETNQQDPRGMLYQFNLQNLVTTFSPETIRGEKDEKIPMNILEQNIEKRNLMFKRVNGDGVNRYKFDELKDLIIKININQIDKTSKYNQMGMPTYIVRSETTIIVSEDQTDNKK